MLVLQYDQEIPAMTREVAQAAFPLSNKVLKIRESLGVVFEDKVFQEIYPIMGQTVENLPLAV
jgi:hypothetical protein